MPNLMQRGATWLGSKLKTAGGRTVAYRQGGLVSEAITAWVDRNKYEVLDEGGLQKEVAYFDWTFNADELLIAGEVIEPRPGDTITETLNGVQVVYQVVPVDNKKCFDWFDTSKILLLVHTDKVK